MAKHDQPTDAYIANKELAQRKLRLEVQLLERQRAWQGLLWEWVKAAAVPVTLVGATVAFYIGLGQIQQSERNRAEERFDSALARLASTSPTERVTGVSGLRLFLVDSDKTLFGPTLQFLVNAVSLETEPRVQSAILDVLADLKPVEADGHALNEALKTAVVRNRNLTKSVADALDVRLERERAKRLAKIKSLDLPADGISSSTLVKLASELSAGEYLDYLEAEHGPFERLEPDEGIVLQGLAKTISIFIALGAKIEDLSGIYCEKCDFTAARDLEGVAFSKSYLSGADFSHVNLKRSSFRDADIGGTYFYAADLRGADLASIDLGWEVFASADRDAAFPLLDCAQLQGADLSGLVVLELARLFTSDREGGYLAAITSPNVISAQMDSSTKIEYIETVVTTSITDSYIAKYPDDRTAAITRPGGETVEGSTFIKDGSQIGTHRTHHTPLGEWAGATEYTELEPDDAKSLKGTDAGAHAALVQAVFRQKGWKSVPLVEEILALPADKLAFGSGCLTWEPVPEHVCSDAGRPPLIELTLSIEVPAFARCLAAK